VWGGSATIDTCGVCDGDGRGNICDPCPLDNDEADDDADGVCNSADLCDGDDATGDTDGDGICDDLDPCAGANERGDDGHCAPDLDDQVWDCDEEDNTVYPGAPELCDGKDNSCRREVSDEEFDVDGDGQSICDEESVARYLNNEEMCDGIDNDCDGELLASELDADGDGAFACFLDCDDTNPEIGPRGRRRATTRLWVG
jgi:hypothetical protein